MVHTNRHLMQRAFSIFITFALLAVAIIPVAAQTNRRRSRRAAPRLGTYSRTSRAPIAPRSYAVDADQTIRVRMNDQLNSETARIGQRFTTRVVEPVYSTGGVEVIPAGSTITGRVTSVARAGRRSKAGTMSVQFVSLQTPNGRSYPISGSLTDVSGETVEYDNEGQVKGRSSTKRNAVFIGGGAGAGALIGAIAGGGKGAGVGAAVGAGLGVAGAFFSRGKEAVVKPGTEFGVILNRALYLPQYR
ncbi:MAG: hypothetical protein WKF74_17625 [Pyrinomonadaceae bacterium]